VRMVGARVSIRADPEFESTRSGANGSLSGYVSRCVTTGRKSRNPPHFNSDAPGYAVGKMHQSKSVLHLGNEA